MQSKYAIIDTESGELVDPLERGLYIQTAEQKEAAKKYWKDKQYAEHSISKYRYGLKTEDRPENNFIWTIYDVAKTLLPDIKEVYLTYLIYLSTFLSYSQVLCKSYNLPMTKKDVQKAIKLSDNRFYEFWKAMIDSKIIVEEDNKIKLSNKFFKKGRITRRDYDESQSTSMSRIYVDVVRKIYESATVAQRRTIGYIFRVLPFAHHQTNILCRNPLESDLRNIDALSLGDLCDLIGCDRGNAKRLAKALQSISVETGDGKHKIFTYVLPDISDWTKTCMFVNPSVYYSGDKKEIGTIKLLGRF